MAPALRAGTPLAIRVPAKVWEAMVAPAVVEAVAPAIRIPARGASTKAGMFRASSRSIMSYCRAEALMTPAMVPVPISRMDTPTTLDRPNSVIFTTFLIWPVTSMQMRPPVGRAMRGSMVTPARGRRASRTMTTRGPRMAGRKPGSLASELSMSLWATARPFFFLLSRVASRMVTTRASRAGTMFLNIREVRSTPKASEAAMVLGFGETMLPALPPPIMASSRLCLDRPAFLPMARAMGATVMTEMSTKTPTAQMIMVARAMAARASLWPILSTMVLAIFWAEPVLISAPASTPEVMIRSTEDIMEEAPETMVFTVVTRPPPPMRPPTRAPRIRL